MKLEGAIFDLDGTLLDSMPAWNNAGPDYLRSLGIEPEKNLGARVRKMSLYQAACLFRDEYGVQKNTDEIMLGIDRVIEEFYFRRVQAKPGTAEFLERLKNDGVKMCVATATDSHLVKAALDKTGLSGYFGRIFTCTEIGHGKDEPDIFNTALEYLGTDKKNTMIFEDALFAVETAKRAGFKVCAVYDALEGQPERLKALADYYIQSFADI